MSSSPEPLNPAQRRLTLLAVCQHHELRDGTMCQMSLDVDAAKLLNGLKM
jgi:hypothetical protein